MPTSACRTASQLCRTSTPMALEAHNLGFELGDVGLRLVARAVGDEQVIR